MGIGVLSVLPSGTIIDSNAAAADLLDLPSSNGIIGRQLSTLLVLPAGLPGPCPPPGLCKRQVALLTEPPRLVLMSSTADSFGVEMMEDGLARPLVTILLQAR